MGGLDFEIKCQEALAVGGLDVRLDVRGTGLGHIRHGDQTLEALAWGILDVRPV